MDEESIFHLALEKTGERARGLPGGELRRGR